MKNFLIVMLTAITFAFAPLSAIAAEAAAECQVNTSALTAKGVALEAHAFSASANAATTNRSVDCTTCFKG